MKIKGKSDFRASAIAVLPRPGGDVTFRIVAVSAGATDKIEKNLPFPTPRVETTHSKGKSETRVIRDDPEFVEAIRVNNRRRNMLIIREALSGDPDVSFESDSISSPAERADGIAKELSDAGFTHGDVSILIDQIDSIGNVTPEAVKDAAERFSALRKMEAAQAQSQES